MNLTIGKLARDAGVNVETIRYYERRGLIERPAKPAAGYRRYDRETLDRVRFIKQAQGLGFTLDEIRGLMSLSGARCIEVQALAEQKLDSVRQKIDDLRRLESVLADLVRQCRAREDKADCPIVESLADASRRRTGT